MLWWFFLQCFKTWRQKSGRKQNFIVKSDYYVIHVFQYQNFIFVFQYFVWFMQMHPVTLTDMCFVSQTIGTVRLSGCHVTERWRVKTICWFYFEMCLIYNFTRRIFAEVSWSFFSKVLDYSYYILGNKSPHNKFREMNDPDLDKYHEDWRIGEAFNHAAVEQYRVRKSCIAFHMTERDRRKKFAQHWLWNM